MPALYFDLPPGFTYWALKYRYKPLEGPDSIRLLVLAPCSEDRRLHCQLVHTTLSSCPAYEALSYVWGEPESGYGVFCEVGNFETIRKITPNLAGALYKLQCADRPRFLWVDSLCIDQDNVVERSHQVTKMGDIYAQAQRVVIWLGEDTDLMVNAARSMKQIIDWTRLGAERAEKKFQWER